MAMRVMFWTVLTLVATWGAANATTYQLQYVGKHLVADPNYGGIPGAKNVNMTWAVPSISPGKCSTFGASSYLMSYTDGANNLASLEAAGYSSSNTSVVILCFNKAGTKVTQTTVGVVFQTQPVQGTTYYYIVDNNQSVARGAERITLEYDNSGVGGVTARSAAKAPGKWTITALP